MKSLTLTLKSIFGLTLVMLLTTAWVGPAAAAAPATEEEPEYRRLEYGLNWLLLRLDVQQDHLTRAGEAGDLIAEIIADAQAAGRDTAALEAALEAYRASLNEAQTLHEEAAQILDEKAGFADDGQVEDPEQARNTLTCARQAIGQAGQTLREARRDLHQALRQYRRDRGNAND